MSPKILIFGTGAIGTIYTWVLSQAIPESDLTAVCRSSYDVAARDGLTVNSQKWGDNLKVRPNVVKSVAEAAEKGEFDYVIVAAKALPTNPSTAEIIRPAVTPGKTAVVLLQNGIGIEEEYVKAFGSEVPVVSTVVYMPATQTSPAVVAHDARIQHLHVGTYPAGESASPLAKERASTLVDLLHNAGAGATLHDDVQGTRWDKLLMNAAWNPICALTRLRSVEFGLLGPPPTTDAEAEGGGEGETLLLVRDVMREVASIARACGYTQMDEKAIDRQIDISMQFPYPGNQPSMLADVLEKRALEADALVGNAVRIAREKGVDTPVLRTLWLLTRGLSRSFEGGR
ncbi:2-dehydropantoate 2-reductase [Xylariaceae sp. FL0255]|nr:2-dehydropantoate 2-reductase [Xylariaceae sp. FL0255]